MIDLAALVDQTIPHDEIVGILRDIGDLELADQIQKQGPTAKPFVYDGASAWPDKIGKADFHRAAFPHDVRYHYGLPGDERARFLADIAFARDLINHCNTGVEMAVMMFSGVRLGGKEKTLFPWRWAKGTK